MGAVLHTLNPRLHPTSSASSSTTPRTGRSSSTSRCCDVVREVPRRARVRARDRRRALGLGLPDGYLDYEALIAAPSRSSWPPADERHAAAMCYTSGTTGGPKGVVYSHRSLVLHSLVAALPDAHRHQRARHDAAGRCRCSTPTPGGFPTPRRWSAPALVLPGPKLDRGQRARPAGRRAGHDHRRRADGLDGGPAGARRRARPLGPELAAATWLVGGSAAPPEPDRGLRAPRPHRHPRLGHDRDLAAGQRLPAAARARRRCASRSSYDYRARQGVAVAVRRDPRARATTASWSRGTTRRWASSRCAVRGSPRGYHRGQGRREVHRRRLVSDRRRRHDRSRTAASGSATAPRTSSSPAASGSPRSTSRTC